MGRKYIEIGWQSYRKLVVPDDAGEVQVNESRQAFYAGAAVLFEGIIGGLDGGSEATDADIQRMDDIQAEITAFGQQLDRKMFDLTEH